MAAGAGNPQLKLQVSLDLAFLRSQLSTINTQLGGQPLNLSIKLNRQKIADEYRLLNRYFGNKTFRVSVETNLKTEIEYAERLKIKLANLAAQQARGFSTTGATGQSGSFVDERKFKSFINRLNQEPLKAIRSGLESAGVQLQSAGDGTVKELRRSILSGLPQITQDIAQGMVRGLDPGMQESGRKGARALIDAFKDATGIASPSRVFKQLGELSADGLEIGFLNGLKSFGGKAVAEIRKIAALMRLELASVGNIGPGAGFAPGRTGRRTQYFSPIGPLPEGSREPWAWNRQAFRYEPYMAQPGQTRDFGVPPMRSRYPFAPAPSVMGTISSASMLGRGFPALPPAGGTAATREAQLAMREFEARLRSAARAASVFAEDAAKAARRRGLEVASGQVPLGGGGRFLPPGGPPSGGGGGGGFSLGPNFGRDLGRGLIGRGGGGVIQEIASEFAMATKQVLLFGTAYKALAAIVALPGNIANATANLQSFRNQLEAVTGGGKIMTDSLKLIEDTVAKFNMPVESARQGFVRLYASMAPAGISGGTINNIFTGLAAASTTLGMSADQVDRMTYALSQMASKGQITSEELKGQLGDVFPQAVSLFAEAAGFLNDTMDEQAKAKGISAFLKALEDGALRGEAMQKVLANVGVLLNQDFGATGQKAADSFRGQINALNNALVEFYESFAPVASQFLGEFIKPIVDGLVTVGNAVKIAFSGEEIVNNPLASYFRDELFPQLNNLKTVLIAAGQQVLVYVQAIGAILRPLAQFVLGNQALAGALAQGVVALTVFRTAVTLLNTAGIIPLIRNIVLYGNTMRIFVAQTAAGTNGMVAMRAATVQTGVSMQAATGGVRALATTIRTVLVNSAIGIAIVAIGALINEILRLQAVADGISRQRGSYARRLQKAGELGPEALSIEERNIRAEKASREQAIAVATKLEQGGQITSAERDLLSRLGGFEGTVSRLEPSGTGFKAKRGFFADYNKTTKINEDIKNAQQALNASLVGVNQALEDGRKNAAVVEQRTKDAAKISFEGLGADLSGADGAAKVKKARESQLAQRQLELDKAKELFAIEKQIIGAELSGNTFLLNNLELQKQLIDFKYQEKAVLLEAIPLAEQNTKINEIRVNQQIAIEQSLAKTRLALQKEAQEIKKSIQEKLDGYLEEQKFQQRYIELVRSGVRPALAAARVEVEKNFRAEEKNLEQKINILDTEIAILDANIAKAKLSGQNTTNEEKTLQALRDQLKILEQIQGKLPGQISSAISSADPENNEKPPEVRLEELKEASQKVLRDLQDPVRQLENIARSVSDAIGNAFKQLITGSGSLREVLAGVFQSIAESFADMVAKMITEWLFFKIITGIGNLFGLNGGGASSTPFTTPGSALPSFPTDGFSTDPGIPWTFAKGGIAFGGFRAFADGGMVTGPTLGLVGEGRYNEAIVPLPDGKSIPVSLQGDGGGNVNVVVNVDAKGTQVQGNEPSGRELGRVISAAVQSEIIKQQRPGGLLTGSR